MKKTLFTIAIVTAMQCSYAQTNTSPWPSTGNVGIGTTTPTATLDVLGTLNVSSAINGLYYGRRYGGYFIGSDNVLPAASAFYNFVMGSGGYNITSGNTNFLAGAVATGSNVTTGSDNTAIGGYGALASTTTGNHNVAIGQSSLNSNVSSDWNIAIGSYAGANITGGGNTVIGGFSGVGVTTGSGNIIIGNYYPYTTGITTGNYNTVIGYVTSLSPTLSNNIILADGVGNRRLNIDNNGNTGIGTVTPLSKLDIAGGIAIGTYAGVTAAPSNGLSVSGNVGIGTTIPDEKLTVKGNIHAAEVKVEALSAIPDYVFEPEYKLQDLNEVKTYVNKNHHLPEIPSAAQIEKDGINLGEMNMKLLKKIEELTLYLIDKGNQLAKQEETNKTLIATMEKMEARLKALETK